MQSGTPVICSYKDPDFGWRLHPVYFVWKYHDGEDIAANLGNPIISVADGVVLESVTNYGDYSWGNYVKIQHAGGVTTLYGHMRDSPLVTVGDPVKQGQVIGYAGSTGVSTGVHLHLEVRVNGELVDPLTYIDVNNPRPAAGIANANYNFTGRGLSFYSLDENWLRIFTAVIIGEGGTDLQSVFWTASAMFNRIDARFYGDHDAKKILTRGWSEVYNKNLYQRRYSQITPEITNVVMDVINGKRAHKYIDFACDVPGNTLASNWIAAHPGKKYEWFKGNMYCDWRDSIS